MEKPTHEEVSLDSRTRTDSPAVARRVDTVDVDNYHGLHLETGLVYLSLSLIAFSQILNLVGSSALAQDIASEVGGAGHTIWLSSAIAILTCVLGPPVSQAADYWGRKWFIVILTAFGAVGCIIISRTDSMGMAIAGEVVAGISYGSQPLLYAVTSEILPRRWRPIAQGGLNVSIAVGGIFSLLVGFTLTQNNHAGFRTFYYIAAGIQGVAAIICAFLYNPPLRPLQVSLSLGDKLSRLDWVGYGLLASGVVLFSMALAWSQNPYPWTNAHILALFLPGVALLIALGVHQCRFKKNGLFHHGMTGISQSLLLAYLLKEWFFLFMITFLTAIVASLAAAAYSAVFKKLRLPIVVAYTSFMIFNILMATLTLSSGTALWTYPIFLGFGLGVCLTCLVTIAQLSAPPGLISISTGLLLSVRSLGGSVALAIYNAIFNSQISTALSRDIAANILPLGVSPSILPAFIQGLTSQNMTAVAALPGVDPVVILAGVRGLKEAYLASFRYIWVTAAIFSAIAAFGALFIINPTKDLNMHVDAPLEEE
ncbi:MFS general substrate transporter [Cadophora sp. DSE1049]|nr:MFS general substrate transporter [Cadophora sp. DSE1049]